MMSRILLTLGLIGCAISATKADEPGQQEKDDAAIRKAVAAYVDAFNKADAKGLAAMWSTNAVYTNPISGVQVVGIDGGHWRRSSGARRHFGCSSRRWNSARISTFCGPTQ